MGKCLNGRGLMEELKITKYLPKESIAIRNVWVLISKERGNMSLEIRKTINGYEDYEITSWGRVLNKKTGTFLNPYVHDKGYLRVDLYGKQGKKHFKVHRLVAEAFIPNLGGKPQINHIDGNNQNNSVSNLEWVTNRENNLHARLLRYQGSHDRA